MPNTTRRFTTGTIGMVAVMALLAAARLPAADASGTTPKSGAIVWVANTSPYYEAGLRSRDIIFEAGGKRITNDTDLYKVLAATTRTQQIAVAGIRKVRNPKTRIWANEPFRVTLPNYLPADVTIGSYEWDWARYLRYYAPDREKPNPLLHRAYLSFDLRQYPLAQIEFTSATAAGCKDPLSLAKLAWLLLRRTSGNVKARTEQAGKLLKQAEDAFDSTRGDRETEAKLEGILMVYYQRLGNASLAAIHARKAIQAAPDLVSNRINYYTMLMTQKDYINASIQTVALVTRYPRSIHFQRLKRNAHMRANDPRGVIEAAEALIAINPDDVATRLQLLPVLDSIGETYRIATNCDYILRTKGDDLSKKQRAEIYYYKAQVDMRRHMPKKAESLVRQAIQLRGTGEEHYLLARILQQRHKWKDAIMTYREARRKPWTVRQSRDTYRTMQKGMDECIEHLWSWQIKKMPPDIQKRHKWLDERKVLRHSFVMRNRYQIRNFLIVIGALLILTGVVLKLFATNY